MHIKPYLVSCQIGQAKPGGIKACQLFLPGHWSPRPVTETGNCGYFVGFCIWVDRAVGRVRHSFIHPRLVSLEPPPPNRLSFINGNVDRIVRTGGQRNHVWYHHVHPSFGLASRQLRQSKQNPSGAEIHKHTCTYRTRARGKKGTNCAHLIASTKINQRLVLFLVWQCDPINAGLYHQNYHCACSIRCLFACPNNKHPSPRVYQSDCWCPVGYSGRLACVCMLATWYTK